MSGDGGTVFSQNMSEFVQVNHKVFFAAADRNKDVILEQLRPFLNKAQLGKDICGFLFLFVGTEVDRFSYQLLFE